MVQDSFPLIRHEIRTLLNHIVGYSDILLEGTTGRQDGELHTAFEGLRETALLIREPVSRLFSEPGRSDDADALKRQVFGLLYDIIALIQTAKRQCVTKKQQPFLSDIQKMLEAANGMVEILEGTLTDSLDFDNLSEETQAELEKTASVSRLTGNILVVDDDAFNREIMTRHLERQGHTVSQAADGEQALETLRKGSFDVILLDVMMPGMNGYQLLERIKTEPEFKEIYVIVISALEESVSIARCLRLGAEDYLPREFDPIVLRARIESCLERKRLRTRERLSLKALAETQRKLAEELHRAAEYVRSRLPRRVRWKELHTDWIFLPSLDLGGDVFGYTRLDDGDIALYLIDVSGHGVEAALLSVSLLNRIQAQSPADPKLWDPAGMLSSFNRSFHSEDQNNLYFTAWFGVWSPTTRVLRYCSAGSPPAVLVEAGGRLATLCTDNPAVGIAEDTEYDNAERSVPRKADLYLFSDGIFETSVGEGGILGLSNFLNILKESPGGLSSGNLSHIIESVRDATGKVRFEDDVSLVGFYFDA